MKSYGVPAAGAAVLALGLVVLGGGRGADAKSPRAEVDRLAGLAAAKLNSACTDCHGKFRD
jgi:hypothetical protein